MHECNEKVQQHATGCTPTSTKQTRTHASRLDGGRKSNHRELQIGRVALHEGLDNGRGVLRSDASEYKTPGILARRQCTVTNVHVLHLEQRVVGRRTMIDREGLPTIQLVQRSIAVHEGNKVQVDLLLQRWGLITLSAHGSPTSS